MQQGRVCVAGYDAEGCCIRPVLPPPGIHESSLYSQGQPIIFPFAVVAIELRHRVFNPPHTEDWRYDPTSISLIRRLDEKQKRETLERSLFPHLAAIFQAPVHCDVGHYVMVGQGTRSLGTIRPKQILKASYEQRDGKWTYRLGVVDASDSTYWLAVTDLSWRYYCDSQLRAGCSAQEISIHLTNKLRARQVYLRIGLARSWEKYPDRCFVQLTGIYTFPDILEGKTFADIGPASP